MPPSLMSTQQAEFTELERESATGLAVSILVPMRNEERWIGRCLDTISHNGFPSDRYEVLVLDGGSTDRSRAIVEQKACKFSNIRLVDNPGQYVPHGLNLGIKEARGRYILIFGAHVEYPANYIAACVHELEAGEADVVGGGLITMPGAETSVARAIALMTQHPFGVGNSRFRIGRSRSFVDTVPYGAYRRELFERYGGYREDLLRNQDLELSARLRAHGAKILMISDARPIYHNVATISKLIRQAYANGLWLGRCWIWYPVCFSWRHAVPAVFVLLLLLCAVAATLSAVSALAFALILAIYFAAAFVSGMSVARRAGTRYLFLLPPLFFVFHAAYGIGTLAGLLCSPFRQRIFTATH
jgi:glycosyltransferase involved in cell wall biosynthesis